MMVATDSSRHMKTGFRTYQGAPNHERFSGKIERAGLGSRLLQGEAKGEGEGQKQHPA